MVRADVTLAVWMAMVVSSCSESSETTSSTTSLPASAITFDDSASALKGADLQALLTAVDGQLTAQAAAAKVSDGRIAELESQLAAMSTERDALRAANGTLAARVQALEVAPPPVIDVLATPVVSDVLPASSLLVTLEALHKSLAQLPELQSHVTALEGSASALASLSTALTECPSGTSPAGDFCMELSPRGEDSWSNATYFCAAAGGHVCTTGELSAACSSPGPLQPGIFAPELTTNIVVDPITDNSGAIQLFDGYECDFISDKISSGNFAPYRCCYDRLVLGAGPPPAEPAVP